MFMKIVKFIVMIPFYIIKFIMKVIMFIFKMIFGWLFGWIPDLDERMSGEAFEEYVCEVLRRNGYKHVELTKRSGDYGIDILADYKGESYAFQCKLYQKPVGVAAVQQVYSGCQYYECDQAIVVTNNRFTAQAKALAQSNGVTLWDGQYLDSLKRKANAHSLFHFRKPQIERPIDPYKSVIDVLLEAGYASVDLLVEQLSFSEEKAFYVLEDLEFHDLISPSDHLGIHELYFLSYEEASEQLIN
jgi:predicted RecB family endonuclease